jgi:hypothetical protein
MRNDAPRVGRHAGDLAHGSLMTSPLTGRRAATSADLWGRLRGGRGSAVSPMTLAATGGGALHSETERLAVCRSSVEPSAFVPLIEEASPVQDWRGNDAMPGDE